MCTLQQLIGRTQEWGWPSVGAVRLWLYGVQGVTAVHVRRMVQRARMFHRLCTCATPVTCVHPAPRVQDSIVSDRRLHIWPSPMPMPCPGTACRTALYVPQNEYVLNEEPLQARTRDILRRHGIRKLGPDVFPYLALAAEVGGWRSALGWWLMVGQGVRWVSVVSGFPWPCLSLPALGG